MKKNLNVIQINGFRGIIIAGFVVTCLAAGFIAFPGLVAMKLWNIIANHVEQLPLIGIIQGILLWGIIIVAYFTFKKNKHVICIKSAEGLSEEELKAVFADIRNQAQNDMIIKNMIKARETELKIKNLCDADIPKVENINQIDTDEKIKSK